MERRLKTTDIPVFPFHQHVLFWAAYLLFWSVRDIVYSGNFLASMKVNTLNILLYAPYVYLNYFVLVPRLYLRKKYWVYVLVLFLLLMANAFFSSQVFGYAFDHVFIVDDLGNFFRSSEGVLITFFELFFLILVTLAIILTRMNNQRETLTQELVQKNLEHELMLLKRQINPHFLFNSLNSIYVLIEKDPQSARNVLHQFSELLSHQIYDTQKDLVPLNEEIEQVERYLEIERVRHGDTADTIITKTGDTEKGRVPPMLFLTFLENAFKHSIKSGIERFQVMINFRVEEESLYFRCANTYTEHPSIENRKGIGLENVKKRLGLLFKGRHQLDINDQNGVFEVELKIPLGS